MLSTGKKHFAIYLMNNGMTLLGLFTPTPWLARLGFSIPGVATGWKKMFVWSDEQMQERLESKAKRTDITSWLIEASKQANSMEQDRNWLNGDGSRYFYRWQRYNRVDFGFPVLSPCSGPYAGRQDLKGIRVFGVWLWWEISAVIASLEWLYQRGASLSSSGLVGGAANYRRDRQSRIDTYLVTRLLWFLFHFLSLTVRFSFEAMNWVQMCLLKVILLDALYKKPINFFEIFSVIKT
ncbi:hypothetical protein OEA41_009601 [Lepraria neglecta]|uniref:Uncharacterized protein n=1 Tax=Lepraria neglecta TaxID=209136 RepID=A0AAE0DI62_9LECA|nr:hypothetical protein OEA41_009601 [Lepraria neglecta]